MKKSLIFLFLFILLTACNAKGEHDIKGKVMDVENNSILVEDETLGLIWLSLPEESTSKTFEKGQTVAAWTDGKIRESYPLQGTALSIEVIK
ncbi:DUF3221 domain-containing protein [Neobacillus sp. DY30]|uniref:DUF3221 domain-containing protein n=1 Tax=Neobacillus sp. DY30 TaxID=3047871 RepID=UPI0024BF4E1C|nr:DUF3221 domain-containing protein [Neobacillus sp. DY30]WHY00030.1 DUF3221 domain-containing protein [Neobacillus sp. DY30]